MQYRNLMDRLHSEGSLSVIVIGVKGWETKKNDEQYLIFFIAVTPGQFPHI